MIQKITHYANGRRVSGNLPRLKAWRGRRDTVAVVGEVEDRIKIDTRAGVGADGRRFAPYTARYMRDAGKALVNMTRTGAMVEALSVRAGTTSGTIAATSPYAAVHEFGSARRGIPARPWFGVGRGAADAALDEADARVAANMRGTAAIGRTRPFTRSTRGAL
jgi:phage gpG-like protein